MKELMEANEEAEAEEEEEASDSESGSSSSDSSSDEDEDEGLQPSTQSAKVALRELCLNSNNECGNS